MLIFHYCDSKVQQSQIYGLQKAEYMASAEIPKLKTKFLKYPSPKIFHIILKLLFEFPQF